MDWGNSVWYLSIGNFVMLWLWLALGLSGSNYCAQFCICIRRSTFWWSLLEAPFLIEYAYFRVSTIAAWRKRIIYARAVVCSKVVRAVTVGYYEAMCEVRAFVLTITSFLRKLSMLKGMLSLRLLLLDMLLYFPQSPFNPTLPGSEYAYIDIVFA